MRSHFLLVFTTIDTMFSRVIWLIIVTLGLSSPAFAGPFGYGVCQAGCSAVVMACYSAAGFTWGATLGATAPATVIACNTAFAAVLLTPTP